MSEPDHQPETGDVEAGSEDDEVLVVLRVLDGQRHEDRGDGRREVEDLRDVSRRGDGLVVHDQQVRVEVWEDGEVEGHEVAEAEEAAGHHSARSEHVQRDDGMWRESPVRFPEREGDQAEWTDYEHRYDHRAAPAIYLLGRDGKGDENERESCAEEQDADRVDLPKELLDSVPGADAFPWILG